MWYQRRSHALMKGQDQSPWSAHLLRFPVPIGCPEFPDDVLDAEERTV